LRLSNFVDDTAVSLRQRIDLFAMSQRGRTQIFGGTAFELQNA